MSYYKNISKNKSSSFIPKETIIINNTELNSNIDSKFQDIEDKLLNLKLSIDQIELNKSDSLDIIEEPKMLDISSEVFSKLSLLNSKIDSSNFKINDVECELLNLKLQSESIQREQSIEMKEINKSIDKLKDIQNEIDLLGKVVFSITNKVNELNDKMIEINASNLPVPVIIKNKSFIQKLKELFN